MFYGVMALLVLLLIVETGFLLVKMSKHPDEDKSQRLSSRPYTVQPALNPHTLHNTWDPIDEMRQMQERMNRLFEESSGRTTRGFTAPSFSPAVEIEEKDGTYIAKADLPGLEKDKIQVQVTGNVLTLSGERSTEVSKEDEQKGYYASERSYGSFSRSIALPGPVDEGAVTADYKNGVLTITLPKSKGSGERARQVSIA